MNKPIQAIVMGASAGGIEAISTVLSGIKTACPVPIIIVLHLPPDRDTRLLSLLSSQSAPPILEVEDKQPLQGGCVYLAPADYHVLVEDEHSLSLSSDLPVNYSRPSIDVLFESAADVFGSHLIGVVLTGANRDGADGLAKIVAGGGIGAVQSPDEAYTRAMPDAAIEQADNVSVLKLAEIASFLNAQI